MDEPLPQPRRNIKMVIAYNGAAYHGWQRQGHGLATVQGNVEKAATGVMRHPVIVHGAGRTDAGVHAEGQVGNFYTTNFAIPFSGIRRAINSRLPKDIAIRSVDAVPDDFHASRSAVGKTYRYRIWVAPVRPVRLAGLVYHYWRPLDADLMAAAARRLIGTHDFAGFASSADDRATTVRTIFRCELCQDGPEVVVTVQGGGFLYNMVRNIVGTLIEIGRGHWTGDQIDLVLATADRRNAGPLAPPDGLTLECVHYDPGDLQLPPV